MSKKPYGPPPGEPGVDNLTYNPQADARSDNAAFDDNFNGSDMHPVGARGADNQPTSRNAGQEDREAEQSENSRQIPRSEVNELMNNSTDEERNMQGRTRGKKVDAYRQERDLDRALDESGALGDEQDIEIGAATGR
ncbi:hypothetical protein FOMPIDRAFT_41334 [Fomitopsis schrenkii]|uniref:Uncharacterized protein n=1 Tax=Fomitopsis schrenkii TaxID=2126942 RepID=S8FU55_FOMSC|nr:hypothetical protein FOMPIDRAFT_41334 [Fomitopsis schrenkii]